MDVDVRQRGAALYVRGVSQALLVEVVQLNKVSGTCNIALINESPLLTDDLITQIQMLVVGCDHHVFLTQL